MARFFAALMMAAGLGLAGVADAAPARAHLPAWTIPSDAHIHAVLADLVDNKHVALGMVVGVIGPSGRRVIAYGRRDLNDPRPVDGTTLFEMGSITKLFTTLLFTDMVQRGEVKLDDPAELYLAPGMRLPERNGRKITLLDLATHTSGLPDFPANTAHDPLNPFVGYSDQRLTAFLASYRLPRDPGTLWDYSSLGVGLLGNLLAWREGTDYEVLVKNRVLNPLGMTSTTATLTAEEAKRLTPGHLSWTRRAPNWDLPTLMGAAALKSNANDMLTFLSATLGYTPTPLRAPMDAMLSVHRPTNWPTDAQAIGWLVSQTSMGEVVHHEGKTSGYRTYIAYDPVRRTGIVVLANVGADLDLGDVGDRLLIGTVRS